jgi:hypothetical protein
VLVQLVKLSQPPLFVAHSSTSVHAVSPVPVNPAGHAPHVRPPGVFVHDAFASQPPLLVSHSLMSVHPAAPVPE